MILGRADDVLNVAGHRIGTAEVESALVAHPDVAEAAIIGKPDEIKGQRIKAFVVLRVGVQPSQELTESIKQTVRKTLGPIAVPDEIEYMEKLPKTRSGKIMRRLLRAKELGLQVGDLSTLED
jgi:acetyl-CoA synthetase